jgi:hypothetical protein
MDALHQYEAGQRKAREEIRQKAARQKAGQAATVNKTEEADPQVCKIARACGNTNISDLIERAEGGETRGRGARMWTDV